MQFSFKQLLTLLFILFSAPLFAQDQGLDVRINEAFTPIANWWGAVVLHNFPGTEIPTIIFLLVGGAIILHHLFWLYQYQALSNSHQYMVRGKYDETDDRGVERKKSTK